VHEVNQKQRDRFFDKIVAHFGGKTGIGGGAAGMQGKKIAFWGIAFKPKTDDIREAPALTLIRKANGYGATCVAYDPVANENAKAELGPTATIVDDMYAALKDADALVISTDWDEFKSPDFAKIKSLMKAPVIFDGRNLYRLETGSWKPKRWRVHVLQNIRPVLVFRASLVCGPGHPDPKPTSTA
jgi:UDPglucose 6-dehydrogenase